MALNLALNGYSDHDRKLVLDTFQELAKLGSDPNLLETIAIKAAAFRLEPKLIIAAMLSDFENPPPITVEPEVTELVGLIRRCYSYSLRLSLKPQHPTSTTNLINLLIAEAGETPAILVMLITVLARLKYAPTPELGQRTLLLWAPLANRLGAGQLKHSLEDRGFAVTDPDKYHEVVELIARADRTQPGFIKVLRRHLKRFLRQHQVPLLKVEGRIKHPYSVYRKLLVRGDINDVHDLVAVRIITNTKADCYRALEVIQAEWPPLIEAGGPHLRDYIANPKRNGYRSLHLNVKIEGKPVEIQIRTRSMHAVAEAGSAAHWSYDSYKATTDYQKDEDTARIKLRSTSQLYIFSPKGDVWRLPTGATALDFAFGVHTSLGSQARAAKINGKIAKLNKELASGDVVEIVTQKNSRPHPDWLRFVKTNKARNRIRAQLS